MSLPTISHSKYLPQIDGLRAVAVLAILFFHAGIGCPGGYVGVDVFFVISGYLITGIILKDLDGNRFQLLKFWERRVRRILPPVAVVVLFCVAVGWLLFLPLDFKELGQSVLAQALLVSNVYFWKVSGYFEQTVALKPLLHTWSLAVEEQFYLLFPAFLIACQRFSRRSIRPAILWLGLFSFSLSVYASYWHSSANYYLLPTRAWELLTGAFLAAIPVPGSSTRWLTESLSWGGFLAVLSAVFFYDRGTRFPGVTALLPCVGTASIIWANSNTLTSAGKILAARPIVFIGLISYSLYLWHWPVLVFVKYWNVDPVPASQRLLLLLASIVLAAVSWRWLETPFRLRLVLKSQWHVFAFAGSTVAILFFVGLAVHRWQGLPSRIPAEALRYAEGSTDRAFLNELSLRDAVAGDFVELGGANKRQPIELMVWGDSHAMAAMPILDLLCKEHAVRGVAATHSSFAPLVNFKSQGVLSSKEDSIPFSQAIVQFIRSRRMGDVILVANWSGYVRSGETGGLRRALHETIRELKGSGARLWIMKQVPLQRWNVPHALAFAVSRGHNPEELGLSLAEQAEAGRFQESVFGDISASNVTVLDPALCFLTPRNSYRVAKSGKALYCDDNHLTIVGSMELRPLFEPIFEGMGRSVNSSP